MISVVVNESTKRGKQGFTLVETVIAILILALGLGAAAITFNLAMRSVATNRSQMTAMHYSRQELERLRALSFGDPALDAGQHTVTATNYSGSYFVTVVDPDLKNVTMRIDFVHSLTNGVSEAVLTTSLSKALH